MEFQFEGKGHALRGLRGHKIKVIEKEALSKAMSQASHLCML